MDAGTGLNYMNARYQDPVRRLPPSKEQRRAGGTLGAAALMRAWPGLGELAYANMRNLRRGGECRAAIWMGKRIASLENVPEPSSFASSNLLLLPHRALPESELLFPAF